MVARVQYKRKHTYRTRSNQVRKFRTPGMNNKIKLIILRRKTFCPIHQQKKRSQSLRRYSSSLEWYFPS